MRSPFAFRATPPCRIMLRGCYFKMSPMSVFRQEGKRDEVILCSFFGRGPCPPARSWACSICASARSRWSTRKLGTSEDHRWQLAVGVDLRGESHDSLRFKGRGPLLSRFASKTATRQDFIVIDSRIDVNRLFLSRPGSLPGQEFLKQSLARLTRL